MELTTPAAKGLERAFAVFLKDLEALPHSAFNQSFGPATRTVADIVYEVNMVNDHIGMVVRGEEAPAWPDEGWIKAPFDFQTKEAVIAGFKASSDLALTTAAAINQEQMQSTVKTEQGDRTIEDRIRFMAIHIWYHSGQLNFIQTLLGDAGFHWN